MYSVCLDGGSPLQPQEAEARSERCQREYSISSDYMTSLNPHARDGRLRARILLRRLPQLRQISLPVYRFIRSSTQVMRYRLSSRHRTHGTSSSRRRARIRQRTKGTKARMDETERGEPRTALDRGKVTVARSVRTVRRTRRRSEASTEARAKTRKRGIPTMTVSLPSRALPMTTHQRE